MSAPHYPGRAPIEAYGNGGFRFAGMSHRGSILCLPSGVMAWSVMSAASLTEDSLSAVLAECDAIGFLLLGMGRSVGVLPAGLRKMFVEAKVGLEPMDTGAACRTYNVLLAEGRPVAAALIAVD